MSKGRESIVASLELCKLIPEGEFEDSALVWRYDRICGFICLLPGHPDETARLRNDGMIYPAPTLVEILKKIPDCVEVIRMKEHNHCMKATGLPLVHESSLADCALRLWLMEREIEVKA